VSKLCKQLTTRLEKEGNVKTAAQQKKYLKEKVECYGLKAPTIKLLFKEMWNEEWKSQPYTVQYEVALTSLKDKFIETQCTGMLLLEKIYMQQDNNCQSICNDLKMVLMEHCNTWATCDGISKILRLLIKQYDHSCVSILKEWKSESKHIWVQRAACVSFVCLARHGNYDDVIMEIVSECVKNNERFVQLGVGWVLRELSLSDLDRVVAFIKTNYDKFSREGLRYAIEKMTSTLRKELLDFNKSTPPKSRKRSLKSAQDTDVQL